jgi:hypothetical protein
MVNNSRPGAETVNTGLKFRFCRFRTRVNLPGSALLNVHMLFQVNERITEFDIGT